MANPATKIIIFNFSYLIVSVRRPSHTCASFFFFLCQCLSPDFFVSATVHTTLTLTSSFLISLAVQFLCVSRFCFCVLSGAVYVYVYVYMYMYMYMYMCMYVYVYMYMYM